MSLSESSRPTIGHRPAILSRIEAILPSLREAERKVAAFVVAHPTDLVHLTVTEVADRTETSEATVIRFARRMGFAGYAALKIDLALGLQGTIPKPALDWVADDVASIKRQVLERDLNSLSDTAHLLDDESLGRAVDALLNARRIEVYGVGGSAAMAFDAYALWIQIGLPIIAVTDSHLQVMSAVQLQPTDVAVAISTSGSTRDTVEALRAAKETGATTICLTCHGRSPITRVADIVLLAAAQPMAMGGHQIYTRVSQIAVIDVLAAAVALRREGESLAALARGRQAISANKRY